MIRNLLFQIGGILLVLGAVMPMFLPAWAPFVFGLGAVLFCSIQLSERYEGSNLVIRRLRRQQILGALLLLVTACLLFTQHFHIRPFTGSEWKICLMISTLLEVYTIFRISSEEEKEKGEKPKE